MNERNTVWANLRAGACVALVLLVAVGQMPVAVAQAAAPSAQGQTTQVPSASPQGVSPTAAAPPQAVQNDTTGVPGFAAGSRAGVDPALVHAADLNKLRQRQSVLAGSARDLHAGKTTPSRGWGTRQSWGILLRDGKIYLSLADAVTLTLENNYDIAIARVNLDIADTDLLRAEAGSTLRGVSTGLITNTLGGSTSTITGGGGPGGTNFTSAASTGSAGLVLSTNGSGPLPEAFDPVLTGTLQYERSTTPQTVTFLTGTNSLQTNTSTYNFGYQQGFSPGTLLSVTFDNARQTTNSIESTYNPALQSSFRAQATQHILQGFGTWINKRFIVQAKNDRRIADSAFRQQVIYTISQVESIYWALVNAYEDVQAKERALGQSTQLAADDRRQVEIGTLAPLDVVNADSQVATDKQALISSQSNLEYQQLLMKQAIARNLNDPQLANAPVVPTDRVGLNRLPEEDAKVEDLVSQAYANNPSVEQAVLSMQNNKITIRAEKNGLLPIVDAYGFYGASALGGTQNPLLNCGGFTSTTFQACPAGAVPAIGYGSELNNLVNNNAPDYGVGVNVTIPLRNRTAQADQVRSQMEYRQAEMRLQQIYTQLRIQLVNQLYALSNDRAAVTAAQASRDYNFESFTDENKKLKLGASTTANVLQQGRNLATAEDNLNSALAAYARDRSTLSQILSNTLDRYGISLGRCGERNGDQAAAGSGSGAAGAGYGAAGEYAGSGACRRAVTCCAVWCIGGCCPASELAR